MIHRLAIVFLLAITAALFFSGEASARTHHASGLHAVYSHSFYSRSIHTGHRRASVSRSGGRHMAALRRYAPARSHRLRRASVSGNGAAAAAQSFSMRTGGGGSDVVAEARRWLGTNPTGRSRLWCARFMNFVLARSGHRGTGSDMARSFASLGHRVSGPQVGAIAVMARRGGGHVGVVSGLDARGNPIVISGNHGRRVAESVYSRGQVMAYVMP